MLKLDEENYIKSVLIPAVEAFSREGKLPDVFERYNLPIEVSDGTVIDIHIRTVTDFWNKQKINPRYKNLLSSLLDQRELKESQRILRDQELRQKARDMAKVQRRQSAEARFSALTQSIEIVAGKGFITPDEKKKLIANHTRAGLSEKDIAERIKVPVKEIERPSKTEGLPKTVRDDIRGSLRVLNKRDLYDFLDIPSSVRKEEIETRYKQRDSEWRQKPNDHLKTAAVHLLSIVRTYLINGDPAKYEQALCWEAIEALRPDVEILAANKRITRDVFQKLNERAIEHGIAESRASEYIISLAEELGASVEWVAVEETIRCANCLTARPRKSSTDRCTICGDPLWVKCPKCANRIPSRDQACGDCGFVLANQLQFESRVRLAEISFQEGDLSSANRYIQEAHRLWPEHPDLVKLLARIKSKLSEIDEQHKRMQQALTARRIYEARNICIMIMSIAPEYMGHGGRDARYWEGEIARQIAEVEVLIAKALVHEHSRQPDEAARVYLEALRQASDAEEARRGLQRCSPQPPLNLRASLRDDHVLVEWEASPSVGEIEYLVVAKSDIAPVTPEDGQLIARLTNILYLDKTPAPGSVMCYAVFAERGGARSRPAASTPLLVAREVEKFALDVKDGAVHGSWRFDARQGRVCIYRKEGAPPIGREGEEIKAVSADHFIDRGARQGQVYYYRVLVEYHDRKGDRFFTAGRVENIRLEAPPLPLDRFEIAVEQTHLRFSWKPLASGAVKIFRAVDKPPLTFGEHIRVRDLACLGAPLDNVGDHEAHDRTLPAQSMISYFAVTISGDAAVVGAIQNYIATEDISDLNAQDFGHYLQLQWRWPDRCQSAVVAWRPDAYPQNVTDPAATSRRVTKGEYERMGGFRIENPILQPYRLAVFAALQLNGETIFSQGLRSGTRAELRTTLRIPVEYFIKRPSWGQRDKRWKLVMNACQDTDLPEIVLVAKPGEFQPTRIEDGHVMANFSHRRLRAGIEKVLEFAPDGLRRPSYLRLFFREQTAYQRFQLIDPPPAQLKVR